MVRFMECFVKVSALLDQGRRLQPDLTSGKEELDDVLLFAYHKKLVELEKKLEEQSR